MTMKLRAPTDFGKLGLKVAVVGLILQLFTAAVPCIHQHDGTAAQGSYMMTICTATGHRQMLVGFDGQPLLQTPSTGPCPHCTTSGLSLAMLLSGLTMRLGFGRKRRASAPAAPAH